MGHRATIQKIKIRWRNFPTLWRFAITTEKLGVIVGFMASIKVTLYFPAALIIRFASFATDFRII
ncbi:MAG: hypothetical protein PHQ11_07095 [Paludibacter sp.]|nr:hypothetical protein [Paludibacter sp.]MDD4427429.1 hypothetical protein [Paludibacter sp.]